MSEWHWEMAAEASAASEEDVQVRQSSSMLMELPGTASLFFHKISVFMLLENYCAASLFPPALSASLRCRYNVAATHTSDCLHVNVAL